MKSFSGADANMLLTSVGPSTDAMRQRLYELGEGRGRATKLNVLRVVDSWEPFKAEDEVGLADRAFQRLQGAGVEAYSNAYMKRVLGGRAAIKNVVAADFTPEEFEPLLGRAELLMVPGGNTFLGMRGLASHSEFIRQHVAEGLPYVSESAGSIMAGESLGPASLPPGDTKPSASTELYTPGLGLVAADVIPHASGRQEDLSSNRVISSLANMVLRPLEVPAEAIADYQADRATTEVIVLQDDQALSIRNGQPEYL